MKKLIASLAVLSMLCACSGGARRSIDIGPDADISGLRVATTAGSSYDIVLSKRTDITLLRYSTRSDELKALVDGRADVIWDDEVAFNKNIRSLNGVKIATIGANTFPTAFMFNKENSELAQACTDVLRRMESDGTLQQLKDFWLTGRYLDEGYSMVPLQKNTGTPIRVATGAMSAPITFMADEKWYGIEADIMRTLANELHRPLEIDLYDVAGGILALKSGVVDILCGGVFITPERERDFLFSIPYHNYHSAYFVNDLENGKEKIGFLASVKRCLVTENRWKYITNGLWETIKISILSILLGSILGAGLYFMKRSRRGWVRAIEKVYKSLMAGIPQLVLLLILFYAVFAKSGVPPDMVAVIAFAMFFATAACNIYDSSLGSVPHGQTEAGLALGFTPSQTFLNIVLPQAIRHGLPLYKSQCIGILKGTSIVGYIAIHDLTRAGDLIRSRTFDAVLPLLIVTVIYFLLVWLFGVLLDLATPKKKVL